VNVHNRHFLQGEFAPADKVRCVWNDRPHYQV
jgi:hypothetical protein